MRRYERAMLLERLCELRSLYAMKGDLDGRGMMSIDEAIRYAEESLASGATQALPGQSAA